MVASLNNEGNLENPLITLNYFVIQQYGLDCYYVYLRDFTIITTEVLQRLKVNILHARYGDMNSKFKNNFILGKLRNGRK